MISGILIIAVVTFLAVLSHRRTRLEERVYKKIPLSDWFMGFIVPLILYLGWVMLAHNIISRPLSYILPFTDFQILVISFLFFVFAFVGNSIHFTSKILWRYIGRKNTMAARVNEMFHGKLSHYLVYIDGIIVAFHLPLLELNHPLFVPLGLSSMLLIAPAGVIFGFASSKSIFYTNQWFGGYTKPVFITLTGLLLTLIWVFREYQIHIGFYPVSLFIMTAFFSGAVSFITRQAVRLVRMKSEKRLKLLGKIMSV